MICRLFIAALVLAGPALPALEVGELWTEERPAWGLAAADFPAEWQAEDGLTWRDDRRGSAFYYYLDSTEPMTFLGMPVAEAGLDFPDGQLSRIELLLLTPGEPFNEGLTVQEVVQWLDYNLGPADEFQQDCAGGEVSVHCRYWHPYSGQLALLWAERDGVADYIKMVVTPGLDDVFGQQAVPVAAADLPKNGRRLKLPPARQGERQFCAAAAIEMVLGFYGSRIDQHLLAVLLAIDPESGAQMDEIADRMELWESALMARYDQLFANENFRDMKSIRDFFRIYNRKASEMGRPELNLRKIDGMPRLQGFAALSEALGEVDPAVMLALGDANPRGRETFRREVIRHIRRGMPLLWTALTPDGDDLVAFHMRLITGYDSEKNTLEYLDPQDPAGRTGSMDFGRAWALTNHLAVLIPTLEKEAPELLEDEEEFQILGIL